MSLVVDIDALKKTIMSTLGKSMGGGNKKNIVKRRRAELKEKLGDVDRNTYRRVINGMIRDAFYHLVDGKATGEEINLLESVEFGTKQWSDDSFNIMKTNSTCGNLCIYCYVSGIYNHYGRIQLKDIIKQLNDAGAKIIGVEGERMTSADRQSMLLPFETDEERASKYWGKPKMPKLFMIPTAHDIFPSNVDYIISNVKDMLTIGHSILIVSKPRLECIRKICEAIDEMDATYANQWGDEYGVQPGDYKKNVTFRFTIGSNDQTILDFWEPFAPGYAERVECLKLAMEMGYETSVSMEPFLSDPAPVIEAIDQWVSGEIWIGEMNAKPSEKVFDVEFTSSERAKIDEIATLYQFDNINRIVTELRSNQKVNWKESIIKVFLKARNKRTRKNRSSREVVPTTLLDYGE